MTISRAFALLLGISAAPAAAAPAFPIVFDVEMCDTYYSPPSCYPSLWRAWGDGTADIGFQQGTWTWYPGVGADGAIQIEVPQYYDYYGYSYIYNYDTYEGLRSGTCFSGMAYVGCYTYCYPQTFTACARP